MLSGTSTKNRSDIGLRLDVSVNQLKLRESRNKYAALTAMSTKEAEELILAIMDMMEAERLLDEFIGEAQRLAGGELLNVCPKI